MKPVIIFVAPVLAFVLAAIVAGLVSQHENPAPVLKNSLTLSPRTRAAVLKKSSANDISAVLAKMERQIIHFHPPEVKTYHGEKMEALMNNENMPLYCGSGMAEIEYSMGWARDNPQEMFEWLNRQSMVVGYKKQMLTRTLFSEWAAEDMTAALAAIPRIPDPELRAQSLISTLEILCQKDPTNAQELLSRNLQTLESLKSVSLGYDNGKTRTELLLSLPPGRLRSMLLAENISNLTMFPSNGDGAIATELWVKLPDDERREMVAEGLTASSRSEIPLEGLEDLVKQHAEASKDPERARQFIAQYGKSWAERDPSSAVQWTVAHLQGKVQMDQSLKLITHAAAENFYAAMRTWEALPDGSLRDQAAKILVDAAPAGHAAEKAMLQDSLPKSGVW